MTSAQRVPYSTEPKKLCAQKSAEGRFGVLAYRSLAPFLPATLLRHVARVTLSGSLSFGPPPLAFLQIPAIKATA
jgi:hypothetical protein